MTRRLFMASCAAPALGWGSEARPLFDGKSLAGWKHSAYGLWTVEDGSIVGRYDRERVGPGYLFTTEEFGDFDLELDFWISKGGNSGVFVRQPLREFGPKGDARPAHSAGDGVEVQIDYNDPKNYTGAIYDLQKPLEVVGGEERWNHYRVQGEGARLRVWIDGKLVNDYGKIASLKGAIGLQMHGATPHDHVVRFRDLRVKS